ncbi:hypothetical protein HNP98_003096 [Hymenobacter sp. 9A]|uniref:Uncharacterized protein n=1 Tax=Hymenobacter caeli TaxID=2735894 RepID=A0ABX2FUT7_9BACT|nr:hypothetical protein [Hymenobacter caeli]
MLLRAAFGKLIVGTVAGGTWLLWVGLVLALAAGF